jgi:aspartyl-tRNA(Asn)/glutamyl-tRNA(Gln) amidotransferase subunit C
MEITLKMIDHLAHLSRLEFDMEKKEAIQYDITRMVGFIEKLQEVNTEEVEPLIFMSDVQNVWRKDEIKGSTNRDEALANSPAKDKVYFKVPTVIKK